MRLFFEIIRIRHPRFRAESFDLVVAPRHDYYTSTTATKGGHQQEVLSRLLLRGWVFPREPPPKNLVCHQWKVITCCAKRWRADSE
jgi:hypothetical protein